MSKSYSGKIRQEGENDHKNHNIKSNQGETDVKDDDPTHPAREAGEPGNWDEFQLYGNSADRESAYRSRYEDAQIDQALMERIRNRSIGQRIRQLELEAA